MKKLLTTAIILMVGFCGFAKGVESKVASPKNAVSAGTKVSTPSKASGVETVVWAGLDYALVRMIGGENFEYGFNVPDTIFPGMFEKWNQLFLDERAEVIAHTLRQRVLVDISGVTERNKTATAKQIILTPGPEDGIKKSHISPQDIAAEVQSYKMTNTNGLGLVFIVDRLTCPKYVPPADHQGMVTVQRAGAAGGIYVVFFDIATRKVISSKREVYGVSSGGNFRNFWFGPIKDTDKSLSKYR